KYLKVVARHLRNPPPDALAVDPGCDRELAELARTMMAKKPVERPSYDQLIHQLSHIVARLDPLALPRVIATRERSRPIALPSAVPRADESPLEIAPPHDTSAAQIELPRAGLPGWLVALTFVCIAVFVAGVVVYLRRDDIPPPPPSEPGSAGMVLVRKPDG